MCACTKLSQVAAVSRMRRARYGACVRSLEYGNPENTKSTRARYAAQTLPKINAQTHTLARARTHICAIYILIENSHSPIAHSACAPLRGVRSPHVHSSWPSSSSHSFYRNNQLTQFSLFVFFSGPMGSLLLLRLLSMRMRLCVCMCWRVGSGFGVECERIIGSRRTRTVNRMCVCVYSRV